MWRRLRALDGATQVIFGLACMSLVISAIFADLGLNLLTETIGIGVTVFLIDLIYERREQTRLAPALAAARKDAEGLARTLMRLAVRILYTTITVDELHLLRDPASRLSDPALAPVYGRLDIKRMVTPLTTAVITAGRLEFRNIAWPEHLVHEWQSLADLAQDFGQRWAAIADPNLVAACHALEEGWPLSEPEIGRLLRSLPGEAIVRMVEMAEAIYVALDAVGPQPPAYRRGSFIEPIIEHVEAVPLWTAEHPHRQPGAPHLA